jgi:hypothetical protein
VKLRVPVALSVIIVATSVFAQPQPLSLCIVQTKSDAASQDELSAGPFAMAMYNQVASQRLQNGIALHITVLAASMERDILPEVHRLHCSWSLQLWYHRSTDRDTSTGDSYIPMGDQEITQRLPGRVAGDTRYSSAGDLAQAMIRAAKAHGQHEKRIGQADPNWPAWYAEYMVREQSGEELPV